MNKLLTNPAIIAALGILSGTVVGLGWFWRAANVLVEHAIQAQPAPAEVEGKSQGWDFWTIEIDGLDGGKCLHAVRLLTFLMISSI